MDKKSEWTTKGGEVIQGIIIARLAITRKVEGLTSLEIYTDLACFHLKTSTTISLSSRPVRLVLLNGERKVTFKLSGYIEKLSSRLGKKRRWTS